jgi:hypothetical protein
MILPGSRWSAGGGQMQQGGLFSFFAVKQGGLHIRKDHCWVGSVVLDDMVMRIL